MIRSMTGFGQAETAVEDGTVRAEVHALNGKGLTVDSSLPPCLDRHRSAIEKLVYSITARGTVKLRVNLPDSAVGSYLFDEKCFDDYIRRITEKARSAGLETEPDPAAVAALPGVIRRELASESPDEQVEQVLGVVKEALEVFVADRTREGTGIQDELCSILDEMDSFLQNIENRLPELVTERHVRYRERIEKLAGDMVPEDVIAREAALICEKHDISEEIHRLKAHMEEFRKLLNSEDAPGRKLEFLGQEMHRESSTMCSKADDTEVSHTSMDIRAMVQRIRELVLNVE